MQITHESQAEETDMFRDRQPIPGQGNEPPKKCPECDSPRVTTTSKAITASTYWRCEACGEIWNVGRRQPTHRYTR
jgi:ribosomal protein L37AE/L43A